MNCTLMSPLYPALEQRRHPVDKGQQIVPDIAVLANHFVEITIGAQPRVPPPIIGANQASGFYTISHGPCKARGRCIGHSTKAYPSDPLLFIFNRHYNQTLAPGTTSSLTRCLPAYIGLIYLHGSSQPIPSGPHHGSPQLMKPGPSGSIATKSQNSLKPQGADSVLLTDYIPHSPEPKPQRLCCVLKDSPGNNRCLEVAKSTSIKCSAGRPCLVMPASRAAKPVWPPKIKQVSAASFFSAKAPLKFQNRSRIVFHDRILHLVVTGVKCIAP
jgi:hypothetical protein